jgi:hypothetical protein
MLVILLRGSSEITAGDGTVRQFKCGDVILEEDTWGAGHSTRITSEEDCINLFIDVSEKL